MQVRRRFGVFVKGRFDEDGVAEMTRRLENVRGTRVENYEVFTASKKLEAAVSFRVMTEATGEELQTVVTQVPNVTSVKAEELDASK